MENFIFCAIFCASVKVSVRQVEVVESSQRDSLHLPLVLFESWMFMKENPDRKKKQQKKQKQKKQKNLLYYASVSTSKKSQAQ